MCYREHHLFEQGNIQGIRLNMTIHGTSHLLVGEGNGPIDAAVNALRSAGINVHVRSYEERSMSASGKAGEARACTFMEIAGSSGGDEYYGVGIDTNIVIASIKALVSGINRAELCVPKRSLMQWFSCFGLIRMNPGCLAEGDIRHGVHINSYYDDPHEAVGKFDFVLANPPFNVNAVDTAFLFQPE